MKARLYIAALLVCFMSGLCEASEPVAVIIKEDVFSWQDDFVYKRCMDVFVASGAVRGKPECFLIADTAAQNESICGLQDQAYTYCDCLPYYDQDDLTERTDFSCWTHSTRDKLVELPHYIEYEARQEINDTGCQGTAKPVPKVPLSIQVYLELDRGILGKLWERFSLAVPFFQLGYGKNQLEQTGDSSAMFDGVYSATWGVLTPFGDQLGMDDIFSDFSQLADDLASGGAC